MPPETASSDGQLVSMVSQLLIEQGRITAQLAVVIEQLKAIPDHEQRLRVVEAAMPVNLEHRIGVLERGAAKAIGWALGSGIGAGGGISGLLAYILHHH